MKKNFVLDTNVLLYDPHCIFRFEDNNIIIPIVVLEELDKFKRQIDEVGRNARQVARYLDGLRKQGSLAQGVKINQDGLLKIDLSADESLLPPSLLGKKEDNLILATAYRLHRSEPEIPTVFITRDINLRLKADALGMKSVDYELEGKIEIEEMDRGWRKLELDRQELEQFLEKVEIPAPEGAFANQLFLFNTPDSTQTAYGRFDADKNKILLLKDYSDGCFGIHPRNPEQYLSFELLLNPKIQLVALLGKAGTGKTLLSLAGGLHQVLEENRYQRLLVSRPIFPMGKELGFLPGDVQEKMHPWMQPIFDNLDFIFQTPSPRARSGRKTTKKSFSPYRELIDMGIIQVEPLTYIRGRSIPRQFMIIDEAQNLTPHEVKTIITRAGEGTKIVLTGDPYQIDHPYLDSSSNGLSYVVQKMRGEKIFGYLLLEKGERSPLAELSAERL